MAMNTNCRKLATEPARCPGLHLATDKDHHDEDAVVVVVCVGWLGLGEEEVGRQGKKERSPEQSVQQTAKV